METCCRALSERLVPVITYFILLSSFKGSVRGKYDQAKFLKILFDLIMCCVYKEKIIENANAKERRDHENRFFFKLLNDDKICNANSTVNLLALKEKVEKIKIISYHRK